MEELKMSNGAVQTTYMGPDKRMHQGFIIGGKTYKDQAGTERIETGSTVYTGGGDFLMTEAGGVKLPGSVTNDVRNAYQNGATHLDEAYAARRRAINSATARTQDAIDDQRKTANRQYADANRAAYQAYVNASNPYGAAEEQRARLGLAGSGYSETSRMRTANTYQQSLSENRLARDTYLRELDNAYREARYNGDIELANALANYQQLVYQHGINAAEAIAAQENAAYNAGIAADQAKWQRDVYAREQELAAQERQRRRELEEREYQQMLWERAYRMAQAGFSNENIAGTLGVDLNQLYRIVNS